MAATTDVVDSLLESPAIAQSSKGQQLLQQGREHYAAEQFAEAMTVWTEAEEFFADQKDGLNRSIALSNLALAHRQLGHWPEAEAAIQASLRLLGPEESLTDQGLRIYGQVLNTQGSLYLAQGHTESALRTWEKAIEIYTQVDYLEGVVKSLINQTYALRSLGFFRQSRDLLSRVDELLAKQPNSSLKVVLTRNMGETQRLIGDLKESQTTLIKSLKLAGDQQISSELAAIHLSLGNTLQVIAQQQENLASRTKLDRDYGKAKEGYDEALNIYTAISDTAPLKIQIRSKLNQLDILFHRRNWKSAQALYTSLSAQLDDLPLGRPAIFARLKLARLLMDVCSAECSSELGNAKQQAYVLLNKAKEQAQALGDPVAASYALGYLGNFYELGYQEHLAEVSDSYPCARCLTQAALDLTHHQPDIAYQWHWQLGRLAEDQKSALGYYKKAFQAVNEVRNNLLYVSSDIRFDFRDRTEQLYREYIGLLLPVKDGTESQAESEFQDNPLGLNQAKTAINNLRVAELESFLACGLLETNSLVEHVPIEQVVNKDKNTAIIYPIILPNGLDSDRLEVLIQLPGNDDMPRIERYPSKFVTAQATSPVSSQEYSSPIETKLEKFRKELERPYFSTKRGEPLAEEIYDWIIRPAEVEGWLAPERIETLVFVLDGSLRSVPMAALRDRDRDEFLIEKYAIAATFGDLEIPKEPPDKSFKVLAVGLSADPEPVSEGDVDLFGPLAYVRNEIQAIAEAVSNTDSLLNEQFTAERVQASMNSSVYNIVHLATHGVFGFTRDETYLLAVVPDSSEQTDQSSEDQLAQAITTEKIRLNQFDAFLGLRNRTPIELLVLSACETATGDDREVLGIAGLAVQSGAQSTLASLWSIGDFSTSVLMGAFYKQFVSREGSKAQALREAQIELIDMGYKPSRWAPYLLVGDWR